MYMQPFFQKLEKAKNLAAIPLSDNDVTTGLKSQVQALGSGNPFTIKTTEESPNSVTLQGGTCINILFNFLSEFIIVMS